MTNNQKSPVRTVTDVSHLFEAKAWRTHVMLVQAVLASATILVIAASVLAALTPTT